jgi:hypothetical protein
LSLDFKITIILNKVDNGMKIEEGIRKSKSAEERLDKTQGKSYQFQQPRITTTREEEVEIVVE